MSWANPVVARLAAGEDLEGQHDGLLLICSWPMPQHVQAQYNAFRTRLVAALPPQAYVYPAATLHCTIATLRAFTAGRLDEPAGEQARARWTQVLDAARAMPEWPARPFKLRMNPPTLEGAAAVFRYDDVDGAVERMRTCVRAAIRAHGGVAAEGGGDRSKAKAIAGSPAKEPAAHIPDIVHSTAVRWTAEVKDRAAAQRAFEEVAATWAPIEITASGAWAVQETVPFMHIRTSTKPWWTSSIVSPPSHAAQWLKEVLEALACIMLPFLYIWLSVALGGKMPGKAGSDSKLHPLAL
ncbi:hypothetical protein AB1Y20_009880 [Prymnesium parvum]|uniref:Protein kinase A anchor protein nuclear localisation signal domain-containing protein n=1 Tax=Prymnesium parvum TaxID=97485 RepID=A0AB34K5N5_PRYPA|mmetsp:Transcript_30863/g.70729  ORF Transcript_30863/g.70729 Transcript_30863/m.70729 type:complete len:296 (-) Transcript_30863:68-955(-)